MPAPGSSLSRDPVTPRPSASLESDSHDDQRPGPWASTSASASLFTTPIARPREIRAAARDAARLPAHSPSMLSLSTPQRPGFRRAGTDLGISVGSARLQDNNRDNWQTLRDIYIDEEDAGDEPGASGLTNRPPSTYNLPAVRRGESTRSLRSMFVTPGRSGAQKIPVSRADSPVQTPTTSTFLSTSPTQMEPRFGSLQEQPIQESEQDQPPASPTTPLLPGSTQSRPLLERKQSTTAKSPPTKSYWPPAPVTIAIFKCTLAYFLASLFTFVPSLSRLLSRSSQSDSHGRTTAIPAYSAHMVATVVVYFNPAKTVGNMFLATRFCIVLACFATVVSLLSIGTVHLFDHFSPSQGKNWDWTSEMGDWVVCVVLIGGSMGFLAWSKLWVNNPSYNSGCSMAAVTIYTVVIKEGEVSKLIEVLIIVFIAAVITNLVCFLVFPKSATSRLQASISRSLSSFSTLLDLLTSTFLLKKSEAKDSRMSLKEAVQSHAAAFKTLKADLAEAKNERLIDSRVSGRRLELYDAAVGSLTRLAQHLAGLRGGARLQEGLIRASREGKVNLDLLETKKDASGISVSLIDRFVTLPGPSLDQDLDIQESVRLFLQFRDVAGHEMDALVSHCDEALDAVQAISQKTISHDVHLSDIRNTLASSLRVFIKCSGQAIKRLYAGPRRAQELYHTMDDLSSDYEDNHLQIEKDDMSEGPNETVFLIYFFLFTLEEFARELLFLLDTFQEILEADEVSAINSTRSLLWGKRGNTQNRKEYLYKQFRRVVPVDPSQLQPPLFPASARDGRSSLVLQLPVAMSLWQKVRQRIWEFGEWTRNPQVRYAVKTGLGGSILAAPAFTERGRPIFLEYRGEWALIAYFAAISPTVGQTNFLSFFRVIGTLLGASFAVLAYTLFPENPVVLPILGALFSIPNFYVITQMPDYAVAGRFVLLTYNLTCLFAYNSRELDVSVQEVAFRRSTSVIVGVMWAAFVSRYWWPYTARRELRMGLSDFCLDLSYLYSKLVMTYSKGVNPQQPVPNIDTDEMEPLLPLNLNTHPHLTPGVRQFMAMELYLQSQLGSLRALLNQTRNEPRLKGPFAYDFYNEVILSCERMLDRLHSMRCVTTRTEWDQKIRESFVIPVNRERREMAGNVILYFYTISAGFRLRTPMPPYLPPAEEARERLVEAIRGLDIVKRRSVRGGGRHLLFFAYALSMQEVIAELDYLGSMMQDAFGVISQSTVVDFEALFLGETRPQPEAEAERES